MQAIYDDLCTILGQLLETGQFQIERCPSDTYPLFLLLTSKSNKVGFAILDGKPEEDYSRAFEKFKDLYSAHSADWAACDLTLVLCIANSELVTDQFCEKKEQDPYFCRKLVIDLKKDLKLELGHLPFIPLSPTIIGLQRPASAQTLLMKHQMKSELAKYLVVPYERAPERIVNECLEEKLGDAEWLDIQVERELPPEDHEFRSRIRLKELEISNFRAYPGTHIFDLDADLVVLFGPNGYGKTSFFDAIDFVCTGGIARLDVRFGRNVSRLKNAVRHLDASIESCFVGAAVSMDEKDEALIKRHVKDTKHACLDGTIENRSKILTALSGFSEEPMDLRIENLVRLFRATHLFGQEFQSLTSELQHSSRLPEDTVSRMLAFQDYVEAINKADRVSQELTRRIEKARSQVESLEDFLGSKETEMSQLRETTRAVEKPETLRALSGRIVEKIRTEKNIAVEIPDTLTREVLADWRTQIEVRRNAVDRNLEMAEELEGKLPELVSSREALRKAEVAFAEKKASIEKLNQSYLENKSKLGKAEEELKQRTTEEKTLSLMQENLAWLLKARAEYKQLKDKIDREDEKKLDTGKKLVSLLPKIEKLRTKKETDDKAHVEKQSAIEKFEGNLAELIAFGANLPEWLKANNRQNELERQLLKIEQQLTNARGSLQTGLKQLEEAAHTEDRLKSKVDELQRSQSELKTLLDNIEKHMTSEVCPVCGHSHGSREALLEKLNSRRGTQPEELRETLRVCKIAETKVHELRKQVRDLEIEVKTLETEIAPVQQELLVVKKKIKDFRDHAFSLRVPVLEKNVADFVESQKENLSGQIAAKQQELLELRSVSKQNEEKLLFLIEQRESLEQKLRTSEIEQNQLKLLIGNISTEASTRQVSLELRKEGIEDNLREVGFRLDSLREQTKGWQGRFEGLQKDCSDLAKEINIRRQDILGMDQQMLKRKNFIKETEAQIHKLHLDLDLKMEQLLARKKEDEEELTRLDSLQTNVTNFEISMDATQMSAELSRAQREKDNMIKQRGDLREEMRELQRWISYFQHVRRALQVVRSKALEEYTTKYGPLASNIQKRLRAVYGFGEIELRPEKGEIAVKVERGEQKGISPSDYFSASQMNVIALSLFLSAALTQTWSSFAPVLLDDPVTHFDDLNAYSLIDLIRGLVMHDEPGKGRQFFVSTCESRLYRLMREKFSKLNGRAIFYVFESIGETGPKVVRM